MTIKANRRSALILATGLFVCLAGPSQAASTDNTANTAASPNSESTAPLALNKYTKHSAHHGKSYARHKSSKQAQKSADKKDTATDIAADNSDHSPAIPPEVANANAQMATGDVAGGNAKAMTARANDIVQAAPANPGDAQASADTPVVAADQLNDVDRALHQANPPPAPPPATASADRPTAPAAPVMASSSSSSEGSTWDRTSLVGKIFIGFGALLTMASAARMFIA
jgi:hypothetical protein